MELMMGERECDGLPKSVCRGTEWAELEAGGSAAQAIPHPLQNPHSLCQSGKLCSTHPLWLPHSLFSAFGFGHTVCAFLWCTDWGLVIPPAVNSTFFMVRNNVFIFPNFDIRLDRVL